MTKIKIGISNAKLALWRGAFTQAELARIGVESELVRIEADRNLMQQPGYLELAKKGFLRNEIEAALLHGEVDVAVHSMKNLPTKQANGLVLTAVSNRADPAEWLLIRRDAVENNELFKLKKGSSVAISSQLRKSQLMDYRPDLQLTDMQENVLSRLEKLSSGAFDAMIAAAGISQQQLDLADYEIVVLNPQEFVPAPAQGVLAWQCNRDDLATRRIFQQLHHSEVSACTNIERRSLQLMDNNQLAPGVYCERDSTGNYHVHAACKINGEMRRMRLSSSTSYGVAERIVAGLRNG